MGCLKKIIGTIIFLILLFLFFALGGYTFLKDKYNEYTRPEREVFVKEVRDFGDLSEVSADFALSRSPNFFGYKKLNVVYLPKNQKISVFDLKSEIQIDSDDFQPEVIDKKIADFLSENVNSSLISAENIKITKTGDIKAGETQIPYADFEADIKGLSLLKTKGTIALYKSTNVSDKNKTETSKLVVSYKFPSGYDDTIVKKFISQIKPD